MSAIDTVFKSMRQGVEYDQATLQAMTRVNPQTLNQALKLLKNGGAVEETCSHRFIKNRKYMTKQRGLF